MKRLRCGNARQDEGKPRFSVGELTQLLQPLLENLFAAFKLPDSAENEYVMKAVMRVISFVGPQVRVQSKSISLALLEINALPKL